MAGHPFLVAAGTLHPEIVSAQRALLETWRRELAAGAARVGWKVGHAIPEVEALAGDQPVVGYLTTATLLQDGDSYAARRATALRAETELVLELGCDIRAASTDAAIRRAITSMAVALELVDVGRPPDGVAGIVAGNVFHRAVVIGPAQPPSTGRVGSATMTIDDRVHDADEQPRDAIEVIRGVARVLEASGEHLAAGDRILAGSVVHVPIRLGARATARICGLGHASAYIAS